MLTVETLIEHLEDKFIEIYIFENGKYKWDGNKNSWEGQYADRLVGSYNIAFYSQTIDIELVF